ncbi:MAG: hypothetical protein AUK47_28680 [Deltaproteobacteria bacterium CG2_30_63_29]|nr:MAG: hypothetical protein AUK47_28680 [Deltaproteobacteria bacterium CG2_30_63_29]
MTHLADWHDRLPRYAWVASLVEGKRVLDLGCGSGDGAALIARAGAAAVVAVDPSSALIEDAKQRLDTPNLRFMARYVEDPLDIGTESHWETDTDSFSKQEQEDSEPGGEASEREETTTLPVTVAKSGKNEERFDIVLALNPGLPVQEPEFLRRIASFLKPGGFAIASVRIDGSHSLADLLTAFETRPDLGEPVTFPDHESMSACFAEVFPVVREVRQYGTLSVHFEPIDGESDAAESWGKAHEEIERFRLIFLGLDEASISLPRCDCHIDLEPLVARLGSGTESLVSRALGLEHRALVDEEQLSQKDVLIDDLEREVLSANARSRELEATLQRAQHELDGLQAELTFPRPPHADIEQTSARQHELEQALARAETQVRALEDQLAQHQWLAAIVKEAAEVQQWTISALESHIDTLGGVPRPKKAESNVPVPRAEDLATIQILTASVTEREDAIAEHKRTIATLRTQLQHLESQHEDLSRDLEDEQEKNAKLSTELAKVRGQLEKSTRALQTELEAEKARVREAEHNAAALKSELTTLSTTAAQTQQEFTALSETRAASTLELAALQEANGHLERQVARFKRGRRQARAGEDKSRLELQAQVEELEKQLAALRPAGPTSDDVEPRVYSEPAQAIEATPVNEPETKEPSEVAETDGVTDSDTDSESDPA